ncbi:MAG: SDR family oxidoreductase [Gammaproteobacteria bacterium]|jgi:NAD(P)-dependent dehydrogenase (short-subunit alcohol dehydrogenase family)|nr:SDR family oxidoreductase [Gammaproteobacteria bacterium]
MRHLHMHPVLTALLGTLTLVTGALTAPQASVAATPATPEPVARSYATVGDPARLAPAAATVLITGANRGIGLEFVTQLMARKYNIIATTRSPEDSAELTALVAGYPQLVVEELDVTDFARVDALGEKYADQPIDLLISNAAITPRYKSAFRRVDGVDWDMARQSWEVNALAPLKIAQTFMDSVAASEQKKIVVLSSKAGSFELGPKMPMFYSYRSSKAALNMNIYTLSFETAKRDVIVTLLSPGQVNTTPGMTMKGNIEPEESVSKMLKVIDGLTPAQNGQFLDYEDGRVLGW